MRKDFQSIRAYFILLLLLFYPIIAFTQNSTDEKHEITIYAMPTLKPLIWDSPSLLCSSMLSCYVKTMNTKNNYLLGHVAIRLESDLVSGGELYIAQTSNTVKKMRNLIFKEKIGMAIIGVALDGIIESDETIRIKLKAYADRKKLAFIKYRVSKEAMERILAFIDEYTRLKEDGRAESEFYGGVFNPRFENEGGGCSAFGLALLELINLSPENPHEWAREVNIPMEIIGGKFNNQKRIKITSVLKKKEWYNPENGTENVDYVNHFIYDPSLMFDWILKERGSLTTEFQIYDENNVPGLYKDARDVKFDNEAPLFEKRRRANLFVDLYLKDRFEGMDKEQRELAKENPNVYQPKLVNIIENIASALGNLSFYTLYAQSYSSSEKYALEALSLDSTQIWIKTNLAHALLLQGKYEDAWLIYQEISNQVCPKVGKAYNESCVEDLERLLTDELIPTAHKEEVRKVVHYLKARESN